jgi:hypothetical protein
MPKSDHFLPVHVYAIHDQEGDEVGDCDMRIEQIPRDITDGKHTKNIPGIRLDVSKIVGDIDGDKDTACEESNASEEPAHKSGKAEKDNGVKTDFIQEFRLFGVQQRRQPAEI